MLGKVPVGGEKLEMEQWEAQIEQVSGRRIRKLHLHKLEEKSDTEV